MIKTRTQMFIILALLLFAAACMHCQQTIPPFRTTFGDFSQGIKINGSFGSAGYCPISTGTGTQWQSCAAGLTLPVSIANGGTGAITAPQALLNLSAVGWSTGHGAPVSFCDSTSNAGALYVDRDTFFLYQCYLTGPPGVWAWHQLTFATPAGSGTYTTATSDTFTVTGATAASHCTFSPTNATAAATTVLAYISAKSANSVTITHVGTTASGGTVDIICTPN